MIPKFIFIVAVTIALLNLLSFFAQMFVFIFTASTLSLLVGIFNLIIFFVLLLLIFEFILD